MKKTLTLCIILVFISTFHLQAQDVFIKILKGTTLIEGESANKAHPNEIEALSLSEGTSSVCTFTGGGGGTVCTKPVQTSFNFMMNINKSVIELRKSLLTGTLLTSADIVFVKAGATAFEYFKIHLEDVYVESIQESHSSGGGVPSYSVSLNAAKWHWTYIPQLSSGGAGTPLKFGWNFITNTEFVH